jgi:TonB family protein
MPMSAELVAGNIAAHWIQAGILSAAAALAIRLLNVKEPRSRLAALHLTMIAIVALPLLQPWHAVDSALEVTSRASMSTTATFVAQEAAPVGTQQARWPEPSSAIVAIIFAGVGLRLLWLLFGIIQLGRFSRVAASVPAPAVAGEIEADLAVAPRYIQQTGIRGPWTFGFLRPTVALPAEFDALAPGFQRAVICHELLHIKRRDIAVGFLEELAVAALWFHPWMWLLRARLRVAREQVVDSRVVAMLDNRDDYVRCLVDMSGHDLAPHFSQAGAGMLRPRELRARVDAMFHEVHMSPMRVTVAALVFVAVTVATGLIAVAAMPLRTSPRVSSASSDLPMLVSRYLISEGLAAPIRWSAAARPQVAKAPTGSDAPRKQINKVYPEYPQDALEAGIKGVVVVDIAVNAAGDVTTGSVVSGPQELRASAFKTALGLKFTPGSSTTAMKMSVDYTLTGNSWGVRIWDSTSGSGRSGPVVFSMRGPENPIPAAARVGGDIRPPRKIKDARPEYPAEAQEARVQGVVILEARVDENGHVSHTRVLRSIPLLDQAAIDSVKQWQYEPTLVNGVATPVLMTVTVNFTLRDTPPGTIGMQILLPDGRVFMSGEFRSDIPILIDAPDVGRYRIKASRLPGTTDVRVSVFDDESQDHLGDVMLTVGGPVVPSPTTPSMGLQLIGVR